MLQEQGDADQLERWLAPVAADPRALLAASFTEPASGSDNILPYRAPGGGMQTRAEQVEGGWSLTGTKHYISNANRARVIVCMARISDGPLTDAVSAFIVDPDANPGVTIGRVHDKAGERLANNAEIFYDAAFVSDADVLGEHGRALSNLPGLLRGSNAYAAACAVGIARECFDRTLAWCRTRIGGGVPIIEHQTTGHYLADMYVNVDVARTYVYRAAWQSAHPESFDPKLGIAPKLVASERCFDNARKALELWGGAGIMREHGIEKLLRDAAMWLHSDGTNIIMRLKLADQLRAFDGESHALWDAFPAVGDLAAS
jgi:alkylation response protein AidB-like acyl-CoA dehydrogenase